MNKRVAIDFFLIDALEIAPELVGMKLVRRFDNNELLTLDISDIEVYRGEEDLGCHASKGKTTRNQIMYQEGGKVYVYLIYGMYWLLNITTGPAAHPQAILIRGTKQIDGPGRVGKILQLDKSFYGEDITLSQRLWIEYGNKPNKEKIIKIPRVGINYAGEYWANIPWRFKTENS
jgi:DNA-3-methyladenine glycosylase